jgi:hypothetical protein
MAFSVKDVLPQWLAGTLARDFGLLAPEQQVVPVYLNDRFYGIHRFVEPVDESFLRRNRRMPGNVFRADTAERGDYFKGLPREVFANPYIWDRVASNDRPGAFGAKLLGEFLADLNTSTFEEHLRFLDWLDRDELSRLLAYLLVCGDPYHMSGVHNQFWYEDPAAGTLHPIVWDVRLLDLTQPPRGSNVNRFWRAALKDPRLWEGTMRVLAEKLADDSLLAAAEERVRGVWERHRDAFAYDALRAGVVPPVGDPETTLATLRKNVETLREWTRDARASVAAAPSPDGQEWVLDVVVEGHAPCALTGFHLEISADSQASFDGFYRDGNGNGVLDSTDELLGYAHEVSFGSFGSKPLLLPAIGGEGARLEPEGVHYRFFYRPSLSRGSVSEIGPWLVNGLDGSPVQTSALREGAILPSSASWHPWRYPTPLPSRASAGSAGT